MPCSTDSPEPSLRELLFTAYVATTGEGNILTLYGRYREALVECMTASDPSAYSHAFTTIKQFADPVADGLANSDGDAERLRELIKVSWELLP